MKKQTIIYLLATIMLSFQILLTPIYALASVAPSNATTSACSGIQQLDSSQSCGSSGGSSVGSIISDVVNILSLVLGAIAIIMIIVSGIRFATSGGGSNGVSSAKNTLIYAIVGLVIAALAQVIVHWVIGTSSNLSSGGLLLMIPRLY